MNLTKLKIKPSETEIHYGVQAINGNKDTVFKSWDRQSPEFLACLQSLKPYLLDVLELGVDYGEGLSITGITLRQENPDGEDVANYGLVISAVKSLANSAAPLCLNTPYIPPYRNENTTTIMDDDLAMEINRIIGFCERFIAGQERAQGDLFGDKK